MPVTVFYFGAMANIMLLVPCKHHWQHITLFASADLQVEGFTYPQYS